MKTVISLLMVTLLLVGVAGCARTASAGEVKSHKPRITAPPVDKGDLETLAKGNTSFAFRLYQAAGATEGNLFYSPYSISEALAMTYAGARGETEKQMAEALSFKMAQERLHPAFNNLDLQLRERGQGAKGKDGKGFRLNVTNAIWGQRDYKFLAPFLDVLAQNYGAGLRVVDFAGATEPSRITINDWVSDQTEGKVKDLVPRGAINQLTRLVLTNAIYFNAAWQYPFRKESTSGGPFNLLGGSIVTVPMMNQTESLGYAEGDGYQAVELPYEGRELSMVILVPRSGKFQDFQKGLSAEKVSDIIGKLQTRRVALTFPKFQFTSSLGLKQSLSALGMGVAFTEQADFSGMNGKRDLLIQDVLHKAFVSVDEAGTEAAAATAVIVGTTSLPPTPVELKIDRPFVFLIRDIPTGSTIFVGIVTDPSAK